jgi:hypothetical protein
MLVKRRQIVIQRNQVEAGLIQNDTARGTLLAMMVVSVQVVGAGLSATCLYLVCPLTSYVPVYSRAYCRASPVHHPDLRINTRSSIIIPTLTV